MSIATIVGGALALFVAVAGFVYLGRRRPVPHAVGSTLRLLAFAGTLGLAIALLPFTVSDSGAAASYLLGVPVVAALLPLVADLASRAVGITTALGAFVMLVWGLLLGLGDGFYFVFSALFLAAAAVASIIPRRGTPGRGREDRTVGA
jgi:hypothetical protein